MVDSSPRPIAASHVLHRLLVPRHPPFALDNLTTKMLASTVQFSTNDQPTTRTAPHQTRPPPAVYGTRPCLAPDKRRPLVQATERQPMVVLSGPNRVPVTDTQPHHPLVPHHPEGMAVLEHQAVAGTDSPVSPPMSTPTRHSRAAGSIPSFDGWCSLERR